MSGGALWVEHNALPTESPAISSLLLCKSEVIPLKQTEVPSMQGYVHLLQAPPYTSPTDPTTDYYMALNPTILAPDRFFR